MCGRIEYVVTNKEELEDHYGMKLVEGYTEQGFTFPHYNIPPSAHTPVVTTESENILIGHWGFTPSWAKTGGKYYKEVINAKAETVLEKPYFRSAIMKRRCLIPVTGFFEWKREPNHKTPYRFHMGGNIFSLAGLYTTLKDKEGLEQPHYAILTTSANKLMAPVHDRMPVIVDARHERSWIESELGAEAIASFLKPAPAVALVRDKISPLVNNPKNDRSEVRVPV